jgi:UDP-N-acetylmuramyl pentapeptide phosphotransferase/UDP-N-acetylglucosamine-1-phosphate transferase
MMVNIIWFLLLVLFNGILLKLFISRSRFLGLQDVPNQRSSHDYNVARGGGFVFAFNYLACFFINGSFLSGLNAGLCLLFIIGLWDDVRNVKPLIRLIVQFIAVFCLLYDTAFDLSEGIIWILILTILFSYLVNVFNFMDGINGMLGFYGFSLIIAVHFFINHTSFSFHDPYVWLIGSLIAFLFYNARTHAKVFSGDVGSLTLSFLLLPMVFTLDMSLKDNADNLNQLLFSISCVSIFLMDSFTTILHRLLRRENIFESHRFHLYQLITPRFVRNHMVTSLGYSIIQLFIIFCSYHVTTTICSRLVLFVILALFFFLLRLVLLRKETTLQGR